MKNNEGEKMKKNIWILHHYATPPSMSGLTRPYNFGLKLKEKGYNVRVFSSAFLHYSGENLITDNSLFLEQEFDGIPFVFVKTTPYGDNGLNRIKNMISFYFNVKKSVKKCIKKYGEPDVIYASSPHLFTMLAGIKIAKKLKKECICEVRDLWPEAVFTVGQCKEKGLMGKTLVALEHYIYKKANKLVFTKEGDVDYIKEHKWDIDSGGKIDLSKTYYINNGVDLSLFNKQMKENILEDSELNSEIFKVVYVGAIRNVNNVGNILECASILKSNKYIRFLIYGDGNELYELKQRVIDEKLENVLFKGRVDRKYIPYILSKSDLNILNYSATKYNWSRGNSSNKLFEYMASGKPIVSTVEMGYSIIKKYNCGYELTKSEPEELAKIITFVYNLSVQERSQMGNNARNGAEEFDFRVLTQKLIDTIEE